MSTTPQTLTLATAARARTEKFRRERKAYEIPSVNYEEVGLAAQLLTGKYPELGEATELYEWAASSRNTARALVQQAWAMAEVEKADGDRAWFYGTWVPAMKSAQADGTAMPEDTPTGAKLRLSRDGRRHVIDSLFPVFVPEGVELDRESLATLNRALIGVGGRHLLTSKHLLAKIHGEEAIEAWWYALVEADKASRDEAEAAEEEAEEEAERHDIWA